MKEKWRFIKYYKNRYSISNFGRIKRNYFSHIDSIGRNYVYKEKILKGFINSNGYRRVCINKKFIYIHQLVARNFIKNTNRFKIINHKDGNKLNNIYKNLEWCTSKHNVIHAFKNNLMNPIKGEMQYNAKLKNKDVLSIRRLYKTGLYTKTDLSKLFPVSRNTITSIIFNRHWKHLL